MDIKNKGIEIMNWKCTRCGREWHQGFPEEGGEVEGCCYCTCTGCGDPFTNENLASGNPVKNDWMCDACKAKKDAWWEANKEEYEKACRIT